MSRRSKRMSALKTQEKLCSNPITNYFQAESKISNDSSLAVVKKEIFSPMENEENLSDAKTIEQSGNVDPNFSNEELYSNTNLKKFSTEGVPKKKKRIRSNHQAQPRKRHNSNSKTLKTCVECKKLTVHYSRSCCRSCYKRKVRLARKSKQKIEMICVECEQLKPTHVKQKCKTCYERLRSRIRKSYDNTCKLCKEKKPHHAKGFCRNCYQKGRVTNKNNKRECQECNEIKVIHGREISCYDRIFMAPKRKGKLPVRRKCKPKSKVKIELSSDSEDDWMRSMDVSSGDEDQKPTIKSELKFEPLTLNAP